MSVPPGIVVAVEALACELPSELGLFLSRFSTSEIQREAILRGLVASIREAIIWRWLSEDAIRPGPIAAGSSPATPFLPTRRAESVRKAPGPAPCPAAGTGARTGRHRGGPH